MKIAGFIKNWILPLSMLSGVASYFVAANLPFMAAHKESVVKAVNHLCSASTDILNAFPFVLQSGSALHAPEEMAYMAFVDTDRNVLIIVGDCLANVGNCKL